ncbi:MAG: aminoacyl-tRNA hydrolase [Gammaproteobacteria bacterium]|nr:aminoacyl-tRNA hydrolase [Gammaproteobacteria bacterium]NNJ96110.1 aminoacyl-tRNA hydrolase [Gammaproteobacteria bacterium]
MSARSYDIKLIVGLGNPGSKYTETRHNAGFWFVEALAQQCRECFRPEKKFHGELARIHLSGKDIWLLKPETFMNRSGLAVVSLAGFYKIAPANILVAHDEIDLKAGIARLKSGGGHGGHNGLRDIVAHLGSKDFQRLRIGVDHPGSKHMVVDYVLHRPDAQDQRAIDEAIDDALRVMPKVAAGEWEKAMHQLHTK